MNSKRYAIFLDIDGTLMSNGIIQQKNIDAIAKVQQLGHKVFINSGRSYACVPSHVFQSINFDGFVLGMGSHVKLDEEFLQCITFSEEQLVKVTEHFLSTGRICVIEGVKRLFYINVDDEPNKLVIKKSNEFIDAYKGEPITKVTADGILTAEDMALLNGDFTVWQHEHYAEFAIKGNCKSNGMRLILERLQLGREDCIAMGDSVNDIEMLEYSGISIAMGNSTEEIKSLCDYITDTAENAGVAQALEKYIINTSVEA